MDIHINNTCIKMPLSLRKSISFISKFTKYISTSEKIQNSITARSVRPAVVLCCFRV